MVNTDFEGSRKGYFAFVGTVQLTWNLNESLIPRVSSALNS